MKIEQSNFGTRRNYFRSKILIDGAELAGGCTIANGVGMISIRLGELPDDGTGISRRLSLVISEAEAIELQGWLANNLESIKQMRAQNEAARAHNSARAVAP